MTGTGNNHGQTMFVGGSDDLVVTHGATRLDHGFGTCGCKHINAVTEGEERIGGHHAAG